MPALDQVQQTRSFSVSQRPPVPRNREQTSKNKRKEPILNQGSAGLAEDPAEDKKQEKKERKKATEIFLLFIFSGLRTEGGCPAVFCPFTLSPRRLPGVSACAKQEGQMTTTAEWGPLVPRSQAFTYDKCPSMETYDKPPNVKIKALHGKLRAMLGN